MPPKKRAKVEEESLVDKVWEHYRNFLDSCDQEENEDGDVDELEEIITLLQDLTVPDNQSSLLMTTRESLLPVVASLAHFQLANFAISQTVDQDDHNEDDSNSVILKHLQESLRFFPKNCATWSMGANYARMEQLVPPSVIAGWYQNAAKYASEMRTLALELLEGDESKVEDDAVKEWIELLILVAMVDTEYLEKEDEEEEEGEDIEKDEKEDDQEEEEDEGYYSTSAVEATSRFMSAMLLSTLGKHGESLEQLKHFDLSHRLHPNVWLNKTQGDDDDSKSETGPSMFSDGVLPKELYDRMCQVFAPDAVYWKESDYAHRGYYSYFFDIVEEPTNLIEEVVINHLLPLAKQRLETAAADEIVGAEWWTHHRPIQANLGHNLHFDTDETILAQEGVISHPILSSVLYLTTGEPSSSSGPTIVLDQTPDSAEAATTCWACIPQKNAFMLFDGNLLHGVLPCPGKPTTTENSSSTNDGEYTITTTMDWAKKDEKEEATAHRLTFMVGFWTRRVPDKMKNRRLYGPCGPLPDADSTEWVRQLQNYPKNTKQSNSKQSVLPSISPAWETIEPVKDGDEDMLDIPCALDHRFFVKGAPRCFRDSLFEKDDDDEEDGEEDDNDDL